MTSVAFGDEAATTLRLRVVSDIHLEYRTKHESDQVVERLIQSADTRAVLAVLGDVSPNANTRKRFFERIRPHWREVLFVPGNHDYWNERRGMQYSDIVNTTMGEETGVKVLQMNEVVIDGIAFLGATLWSEPDRCAHPIVRDFTKIRVAQSAWTGGKLPPSHRLTVNAVSALHRRHRSWFQERIAHNVEAHRRVVCLSHHAPSWSLCDTPNEEWATSYYSNCDDLVDQAHLWAYGHTHTARHDDPKLVSNPLGYPQEVTGFQYGHTVHIPIDAET